MFGKGRISLKTRRIYEVAIDIKHEDDDNYYTEVFRGEVTIPSGNTVDLLADTILQCLNNRDMPEGAEVSVRRYKKRPFGHIVQGFIETETDRYSESKKKEVVRGGYESSQYANLMEIIKCHQ